MSYVSEAWITEMSDKTKKRLKKLAIGAGVTAAAIGTGYGIARLLRKGDKKVIKNLIKKKPDVKSPKSHPIYLPPRKFIRKDGRIEIRYRRRDYKPPILPRHRKK